MTASGARPVDPRGLGMLRRLYRHMEWADALTWNVVLGDARFRGDAFVLDSLHHIHLVQRAHLAVWTGEPVLTPDRAEIGGPEEVRDWGRAYHERVADVLGTVAEEALDAPVVLPDAWTTMIQADIGMPPAPATLGDVMIQVAAHSVHHRAQVARRIRELGGTPGMIDWIGWVWRGEPAADWAD